MSLPVLGILSINLRMSDFSPAPFRRLQYFNRTWPSGISVPRRVKRKKFVLQGLVCRVKINLVWNSIGEHVQLRRENADHAKTFKERARQPERSYCNIRIFNNCCSMRQVYYCHRRQSLDNVLSWWKINNKPTTRASPLGAINNFT